MNSASGVILFPPIGGMNPILLHMVPGILKGPPHVSTQPQEGDLHLLDDSISLLISSKRSIVQPIGPLNFRSD